MTWRRAALYWAVFLALSAYYTVVLRQSPPPVAPRTRTAFLDLPAEQIDALELRRGSTVVRCQRHNGRWAVTEPADRAVPADLIAALVANLTQLPDVEVVADTSGALGEFGLQDPQSEITLQPAGRPPVRVRLGAHNPAGTAVYAQRDDSPQVFLIGLNVRYYEDLLFEALRQTGR
jgi:hypothetical protein